MTHKATGEPPPKRLCLQPTYCFQPSPTTSTPVAIWFFKTNISARPSNLPNTKQKLRNTQRKKTNIYNKNPNYIHKPSER